ncbi:hypothetical protein [Azospirillum sp. SYSU D00513]|uniref:hypothetical protein n=1 Tax=Azospirillum sp. SYSU D00513 TaxID=2812561 RepID=UPI001A95AC33|nr:hypothetical protein [Azospirillum sp. SYSU D00513]
MDSSQGGGQGGGQEGSRESGQDMAIEWAELVRFRLPPGWLPEVEEHEGHAVAAFRPPRGEAGALRLVTDRVAPKPGQGGVEEVLREMALRFVRPDDPRAGDRTVEDREDGALIAQAVMRTVEDGRAEAHYLWFVGAEREGRAAVAMFSYALPAEADGDEEAAATLSRLDPAIRSAEIL